MSHVRSRFTSCPQSTVIAESSWRQDLSTCSIGTQTDVVSSSRDDGTQFPEVTSCQIQTCDSRSFTRGDHVSLAPPSDLHDFLVRVMPIAEQEIRESLTHDADWDAIRKLMPSGDTDAVLVHTIHPQHCASAEIVDQDDEKDESGDFVVSAVEWNCNSSMLVLAFKKNSEHESWCSHESSLLFFSLYRRYDRNSIPSLTLPVPCITVVKSHPLITTLYALGAQNGNVLIVDTRDSHSDTKNPVRTSNPDHLHHEHSISHLHWLSGGKQNESVLISLGLDGRIFVWHVNAVDLNDIIPAKAFAVSTRDLGRSLPTHSDNNSLRSEVGIAAASFSFENEKLFVIGCCGGAVLLCSLHHKRQADPVLRSANEHETNKFETPVQMAYIPHRSTISCIDFSASSRNLFVSASVDGEVRVYNALDSKPVALMHLEFGPTSACFWSQRHRQKLVIYCLASGGAIRSMEMTPDASQQQSRLCFCNNPFQDQEEVCNLWLNNWHKGHADGEQLCLLSCRGEISIWRSTN